MNSYIHSLLKGQLGKCRTGIGNPRGRLQISSDRNDRMGAKNQNPTKSLALPTKPKKIPGPKFNPKNTHAKFPSHKNFQKALNDITRKTETLALNTEKNTC